MKLVFLGSGSFGLPTLERLVDTHDVALVVTQPDRPAGRKRRLTPTAIGAFATDAGLAVTKPPHPNDDASVAEIHGVEADAFVVIAYGHKLGTRLLGDVFAINLHGSLLPKYRGAAPVQWAVIRGETETGVSVITLAQEMDAGLVLGQSPLRIDPEETAGELHDRLALLGPDLVLDTLAAHERGTLDPRPQDPALVSHAAKLSKSDGTVDFRQPPEVVRSRIHGLTPWPGCRIQLADNVVRLHRVRVCDAGAVAPGHDPERLDPGELASGGVIGCVGGAVEVLEVQPAGGRLMSFRDFESGHRLPVGVKCELA